MMERFRAFWTKVFSPVARLFLRLGISPDTVTIVGTLGVCAGALVFFPRGELVRSLTDEAGVVLEARLPPAELVGYALALARASASTGRFERL